MENRTTRVFLFLYSLRSLKIKSKTAIPERSEGGESGQQVLNERSEFGNLRRSPHPHKRKTRLESCFSIFKKQISDIDWFDVESFFYILKRYDFDMKHIQLGAMGEDIARMYLEKKGMLCVGSNVRVKSGELDLIMDYKKRIHIIEVKTTSGTRLESAWSPVSNMTKRKMKTLARSAILYTQQNSITNWQLDVILVWYDKESKSAEVQYIENIY